MPFVIKGTAVIRHISDEYGLCFDCSLSFYDNFLNKNDNHIDSYIKNMFQGINDRYEMNGGISKFKCKELEVFQIF